MIKRKESALVISSFLIGISAIALFDFAFGNYFDTRLNIYSGLNGTRKRNHNTQPSETGFYEPFANLDGTTRYGDITYRLKTDSNGFRISENAQADNKTYDLVLLGDSFMWGSGLPWSQTLAGILERDLDIRVLNAGVESYSPTSYRYRFQKLSNLYEIPKGYPIIVAVDISDLQDESSIWFNTSTRKPGNIAQPHRRRPQQEEHNQKTIKQRITESFPLIYNAWLSIKQALGPIEHDGCSSLDNLECVVALERSAFTFTKASDLKESYSPLGVTNGTKKLKQQIISLLTEIRQKGYKPYLLSYPWAAQVAKPIDEVDWDSLLEQSCIEAKCEGFITTIPTFRTKAARNESWYESYYIKGDMHFNESGYKILASAIKQNVFPPRLSRETKPPIHENPSSHSPQ